MYSATSEAKPGYNHTQTGPWLLVLWAIGLPVLIFDLWLWRQPLGNEWFVAPAVAVAAAILLAIGPCIHRLTVRDLGDRLAIRFGPIPLFRTSIRYADIKKVEVTQTTFLDGWGIHLSLRGGWVWNIWGWDCVTVHHDGVTHIGTNDAENLARFLRSKSNLR